VKRASPSASLSEATELVSDFLFAAGGARRGALRELLTRYAGIVASEIVEHEGAWGSLAVARASHDITPAIRCPSRVSVLVGDPVVHRLGCRSALLNEEARRALHDELGEDHVHERLDGHFAALSLDTARGEGAVIVDRFGFIPVFASRARTGGALIVGTHVDAVAQAAGRGADIDLVSTCDLVSNFTSTFPHTLYDGVKQLLPGAQHRFDSRGWTGEPRVYWQPMETPAMTSLGETAALLRASVADDVRAACEGATGPVGVLLSGGEDSRAVVGALPDAQDARAYVYADWESREVSIARRVASAHGM